MLIACIQFPVGKISGACQCPGESAPIARAGAGQVASIRCLSLSHLSPRPATRDYGAPALKELDAAGVGIYADKEGMDTSTPHGRAMLQMAAVFAELIHGCFRLGFP